MAQKMAIMYVTPDGAADATSVTTGNSSSAIAIPSRSFILTASDDVYINFGTSTVAVPDTSSLPLWGRTYVTIEADGVGVTHYRIYNNSGATVITYAIPVTI